MIDVEQLTLINVARYGSDEFMILFPELQLEQAIVACQRIQTFIRNMDWLTVVEESIEDNALPIPVSVNMAILPCDGINSIEAMVLKLDKQLQDRKKKS